MTIYSCICFCSPPFFCSDCLVTFHDFFNSWIFSRFLFRTLGWAGIIFWKLSPRSLTFTCIYNISSTFRSSHAGATAAADFNQCWFEWRLKKVCVSVWLCVFFNIYFIRHHIFFLILQRSFRFSASSCKILQ